MASKIALQIAVAVLALVPVSAGLSGLLTGAGMTGESGSVDLDSHVRYLSGLLLGIGLLFWTTVPDIRRKGALFRTLGSLVVLGGLGRLYSLFISGPPGLPHCAALLLELAVVPGLMLWQYRLSRVS